MNAGQTRSERGIGGRDWAGYGGADDIGRHERDMAARTGYGGADGIYSFRPFGEPPSYIGLPQRFCEAKDLWEEREGGKRNEEMI